MNSCGIRADCYSLESQAREQNSNARVENSNSKQKHATPIAKKIEDPLLGIPEVVRCSVCLPVDAHIVA